MAIEARMRMKYEALNLPVISTVRFEPLPPNCSELERFCD